VTPGHNAQLLAAASSTLFRERQGQKSRIMDQFPMGWGRSAGRCLEVSWSSSSSVLYRDDYRLKQCDISTLQNPMH
jgi:hypothetical protein